MDLYQRFDTNRDAIGVIGAARTPAQVDCLNGLLKKNRKQPWMRTVLIQPDTYHFAFYALIDCGEPVTLIRIGSNLQDSEGMRSDIVELSEPTLRDLQPAFRYILLDRLARLAEANQNLEADGKLVGHFNMAGHAVRSIERIQTDDLRAQHAKTQLPATRNVTRRPRWTWPGFFARTTSQPA